MSDQQQEQWIDIRAKKMSYAKPPGDWPKGVTPISLEGLGLFGIDEKTGELHWDGARVETKFSLSARDRALAVIVALSTASMAIVDLLRFAYGQ
jgi:hypothetical protein